MLSNTPPTNSAPNQTAEQQQQNAPNSGGGGTNDLDDGWDWNAVNYGGNMAGLATTGMTPDASLGQEDWNQILEGMMGWDDMVGRAGPFSMGIGHGTGGAM